VTDRGFLVDRATQRWVRVTGRRLRLDQTEWLRGPVGDPHLIGDEWLVRETHRLGGEISDEGGLIPSLGALAGPGFDPDLVAGSVSDFYEHTSNWRLDVWSQWCPVAWPFGWLVSSVFARRLEQLNLPLRPLDVARGMDSRVRTVVDSDGRQLGAAWLRNHRATGQTIYSGWYSTTRLPGSDRPSIRVVFPLPNGSVTVFLRPENGDAGSVRLVSRWDGSGKTAPT